VNLTEGERKALLASSLLVLLAALARVLLQPPAAAVGGAGLSAVANVDSALARAEAVFAEAERRRQPLASGERINPNLADEAELDRLPGIGPALARAILETRRRGGPYRVLQDLERVPGLGSRTVRRLAPYVALPGGEVAGRGSGGERYASRDAAPREERRERLDVNRATAVELEALPGIGPARAGAIVRWREAHGPFRKLEDLLDVPGIGPATLERLRPLAYARP
jgi:competence protein ComEA